MSTDNKLYYIENTPWKDKLDLQIIPKFNIKYDDSVFFHYDLPYSYLKIVSKQKANNILFIAAINCCLRFYEVIKKLYPYNKVYILMHTDNRLAKTLHIDDKTLQTILDIIPDFAIVTTDNINDLQYYDNANCKHIIYGKCNNVKNLFVNSEIQQWSLFKGKIIARS